MTTQSRQPARATSRARLRGSASMVMYYLSSPVPYLRKVAMARAGPRRHNPRDILLPEGYVAEVVATGLNAPVHCTFDSQGYCHVTESGSRMESAPRIVRVNVGTGDTETFFELPQERWHKTGALTGACWHEGYLYFTNTNSLSRLTRGGAIQDLVTGLPSGGDYQTNHPTVGPDGKIYFGQGTVTNAGVVGPDNLAFEWPRIHRQLHDTPARDITLSGQNYEYPDVLDTMTRTVKTGAFVPYGTETYSGQVVRGSSRCNGAILRCSPDGSSLEVVAWGLRNPHGTSFHPDNRLFATEHGIDERGVRYVVGDYDDFYQVREGTWYGWPDFASGIRLDDPYWGPGTRGRETLLARYPDPSPPEPFARFEPHSGASGFDFCRNSAFGFEGDAFVALRGDLAPLTTRRATPAGFKVVRVDMGSGHVVDFAVNRITGPASRLPHLGFERPSHCQFGPDGSLYVVDLGTVAPGRDGMRIMEGTGTLWRIRRTDGPRGDVPPMPVTMPIRAIRIGIMVVGVIGLAVLGAWLARMALKRRRQRRAPTWQDRWQRMMRRLMLARFVMRRLR